MLTEIQSKILRSISAAMFDGEKPELNNIEIGAFVKEAQAQSVFSLIYPALENELRKYATEQEYAHIINDYYAGVITNVNVNKEHGELHEIMTAEGIKYVTLKGSASASYYKSPELRTMGDVDFLVNENDIEKGIKALEKSGFHRDQYEFTTNQSAYLRPPMSTWEIHKSVTGVPNGKDGEAIQKALDDIIDTAQLYEIDGQRFYVPDRFHHGLVLLLHKINHMTNTGIGLRHLCDWAAFESSLNDDEFRVLFEDKLKSFGIWKFTQIITSVCEKYLGAPKRKWTDNPDINDVLLESIIEDILVGGNFGHKDDNRQRELKYLTDRDEGKLGDKGIFSQAAASLNSKVYTNHSFIDKHRFLLPFGWIAEGGKYIGLLITGKRKNSGTAEMLREAAKRKDIYSKMDLFKSEG